MPELTCRNGGRALLFDRLVDHNPGAAAEPQPLRTLHREALHASVRREVDRLLQTRCPLPAHVLEAREWTVIEYGVPDFSALSPQSADDQQWLALRVSRAIAAFEPRLRQVTVTVTPQADKKALWVTIDAVLTVESITEPVSFTTVIKDERGEGRA